MKPRSLTLLIVLPILLTYPEFAYGYSDNHYSYTDKTVEPVKFTGRTFSIEASYNTEDAIVGKSFNLKITITTESIGASFVEILGTPAVSDEDSRNLIVLTSQGVTNTDNGVLFSREYLYDVEIRPAAQARRYKMRMDLRYPGQEIVPRIFYLSVGVVEKGGLKLIKKEQPPFKAFEAGVLSSRKGTYQLRLQNAFPDYNVFIEKITVESDPAGLIESQQLGFPDPVTIAPAQEMATPLPINIAPLTLRNLIKGLAVGPKIAIHVTYNDGNKRQISTWQDSENVDIAPTNGVVLGAVLIGLLLGAIARSTLEFMLFKKQITKKGVVRVVSYSLIFGLLVVLLAIAGKIEIKAFAVSGSYDNPLAMLVIGLIGALAGLQVIIGWYKSLKAD